MCEQLAILFADRMQLRHLATVAMIHDLVDDDDIHELFDRPFPSFNLSRAPPRHGARVSTAARCDVCRPLDTSTHPYTPLQRYLLDSVKNDASSLFVFRICTRRTIHESSFSEGLSEPVIYKFIQARGINLYITGSESHRRPTSYNS